MRSAFLCLAVLAQLTLNAIAEPITVPLYRRSDEGGIYKAAGKALNNGVLAGKVKIGNPPQEFTFAFDTTIGYSWVRGYRCKTPNCRGRCTYYALKSEDAVSTGKRFSVKYQDACVDTHIYTDTFEFAGLTVKDMPFGGAYRMSGFADGFDGYLGLGRSVDFNETIVRSTASGFSKRDAALPDSAFVPNAFQQGSGLVSAQFGMYTTTTSGSFDQSGSTGGGASTAPTTTTTTNNAVNVDPNSPATNNTTTATTAPGQTTNQQPNGSTTATSPSTDTGANISGGVTGGGFGVVKRSNKEDNNVEEQPAGYLVLGGVDKSIIKGDVEYIRLADDPGAKAKNWDICIRHAGFGGDLHFKQEENALASISTATSYIVMPPEQADAFHDKFGAVYKEDTKSYDIKCSKIEQLPPLKMTLEDHIVELPAKYWTSVVDKDRDCCTTKISRGKSNRDWVLGTALTNAFYTIFDPDTEAVGFAIKKGQKDDGLRVYKKSH
ncbi:aspartic peptidase domain-containing protein [Mycotypha africana]|uniref:aspartic peptidase domain-containing protein n=1 Tax=Mycotypha africana TaxID=64632 RepID=UPI0023012084|nr:aspartic peptidase domain-containing protein [Mycotypha africana]KAI8991096.1 aspartic peptidase domain-containing protein [Mycotypha africana]